MSKAFMLVLAAVGLVLVDMSVGFVVHNQPSVSKPTPTQSFATPQASATRPIEATGTPGIAVCSAALLATAAAGILARARRASGIVRKNYGDFQPIVYESHEYASDEGYLPDGTPINQAGNNSLKRSSPPVDTPPPPVIGSFTSQDSHYGIKFSYSMQKDAYADLEYLNDVGYLPDGTPMNKAGNCINHPETIQPDPHTPGSPLPRALLHNSVGYLPDGTPMNAAGNAVNHPDRMQPDMHVAGSPLPKSVYCADVGYLVDGTDLATAGNNSVKVPFEAASVPEPVAAAFVGAGTAPPAGKRHAIGFAYSVQKDVYADFLFGNEVGYLPDGTPMNKAGNCLNHPENIQPDPHAPGSALPRANFVNDVGYLPDGTPLNRAGNAINHPETVQPDPHSPGSALPESAYAADVGYLVDGTPLDAAGNNAVH